MIEYALQDKCLDTYSLNGETAETLLRGSFTYEGDSFLFENNIIENSYLAGSIKLGDTRVAGRAMTFAYVRANDNETDYRAGVNELLAFFMRTEYILDLTNNTRMKVAPDSFNISPTDGGLHRVSDDTFVFMCLTPYWEDIDEVVVEETIDAQTTTLVPLTNSGALVVRPVIQFYDSSVSSSVCTLTLEEESPVLEITGVTLGDTINMNTLYVDNEKGEVLQEIDGLNWNKYIFSGSGFFSLPVGGSNLSITLGGNVGNSTDIQIRWRNRYYV